MVIRTSHSAYWVLLMILLSRIVISQMYAVHGKMSKEAMGEIECFYVKHCEVF